VFVYSYSIFFFIIQDLLVGLLLLLDLDELGNGLLADEHGLSCDHHLLGGRDSHHGTLVNPTLVVLAGLAEDDIGVTLGGGLLGGDSGGGSGEGAECLAGCALEDVGLLGGSH